MILTPTLKVARNDQLDPGEMFLFEHGDAQCVGMMADCRDPDSRKLLLPLGPKFPRSTPGPRLLDGIRATVISFGKEFMIRLPVNPSDWTTAEPGEECNCLVVSERDIYFRANYGQSVICFVNAVSGIVEVSQGQFVRPTGTLAFAVAWEIMTTEPEPRTILKYPYPVGEQAP